MISIIRTANQDWIKYLYGIENLYDYIVEDGSPNYEKWVPDVNPAIYTWLVPIIGTEVAGCIRFDKINSVFYEGHIFIYNKFTKEQTREASHLALQYMREVLGAKKFLGITASHRPYIGEFAKDIGFRHIATLKNSLLKNGLLQDQELWESE
jgi:RimJ/RimL family protein N-acetyltransferase